MSTLVVHPVVSAASRKVANSQEPTWAAARAASSGITLMTGFSALLAYGIVGGDYFIYRSVCSFDTSSIPLGSTINSATLKLARFSSESPIGAGQKVHMTTAAGLIAVGADFAISNFGAVSAGEFPAIPIGASPAITTVSINQAVLPINSGGTTLIGFRGENDLSNTTPINTDRTFWYSDGTSPELTVDYTAPVTAISYGASGDGFGYGR